MRKLIPVVVIVLLGCAILKLTEDLRPYYLNPPGFVKMINEIKKDCTFVKKINMKRNNSGRGCIWVNVYLREYKNFSELIAIRDEIMRYVKTEECAEALAEEVAYKAKDFELIIFFNDSESRLYSATKLVHNEEKTWINWDFHHDIKAGEHYKVINDNDEVITPIPTPEIK